ncbi:DUF4437 domain-containing protein [Shewanella gelidii]|uniref:DUF4437 domain-containing protein n=1 Tax=Shewanella gelidii TaxID=1642821 RepID=A0A917JLU9_9GAMM|nr:DUF4437 domain-containing protein [Shewanella gelidii]MCL1096981.1 DUF4437 domain-containing protein [Shewanella gelidii]GGI71677.1 hypothetical protein GCM10009332_06290 [Shewanella gelidii]
MKSIIQSTAFLLVLASSSGCSTLAYLQTSDANNISHVPPTAAQTSQLNRVLKPSQVEWQHLNPARGDKAPQAGTLWGNRNGTEATGFLLKPKDGFQSPPHIHNVSYRGIVIQGQIHNDDPNAAEMWMPSGSYWTQPKGHVHITAAKGQDALAYIEIDSGPYLVKPTAQAFDSGERAVNIAPSNIVWISANELNWVTATDDTQSAELALLWGERNSTLPRGTLIKLPAGFQGKIEYLGQQLHAVIIEGEIEHQSALHHVTHLPAGGYFGAQDRSPQFVKNLGNKPALLYLRTHGAFKLSEM